MSIDSYFDPHCSLADAYLREGLSYEGRDKRNRLIDDMKLAAFFSVLGIVCAVVLPFLIKSQIFNNYGKGVFGTFLGIGVTVWGVGGVIMVISGLQALYGGNLTAEERAKYFQIPPTKKVAIPSPAVYDSNL